MFIVVFTTESGYIFGLGAIQADGARWLRWFCPGIINGNDFPRVKLYDTRKEARNHARCVLVRAKQLGILSRDARSKVVPVWK